MHAKTHALPSAHCPTFFGKCYFPLLCSKDCGYFKRFHLFLMKSKKISSRAKSSGPDRGEVMNGAEILVSCLEREGVHVVFAYPGGASMPIHQALTKSKKLRVVLPRHEQGGAFAAEGYARATGEAGVCMATSGPGATTSTGCSPP